MADRSVVELDVGAPAHGGACVARHDGRVIFVRHALPGERVRARITDDRHAGHWFADAVEVLSPAPGRVAPSCPHAGPGRCGGCDWQHADALTQRMLKAAVVREQFRRLAQLDVEAAVGFDGVEELPGGLLGWRTRNQYAVERPGVLGLRRHGSHAVEVIGHCPLGAPGIADVTAFGPYGMGNPTGTGRPPSGVEVACGADGEVAVLTHRPGPGQQARGRRPPDRVRLAAGPPELTHVVRGRTFTVSAGGFWQVHPAAAATFASAVEAALVPARGDNVIDLYAGAGLLTAGLAERVGPGGRVVSLEAAADAVAHARSNLADLPWVHVRRGRVEPDRLSQLGIRPDVVVLDPPRAGAGAAVMTALLELAPRAVAYLSCDPATLARDVATARAYGWELAALRAFDAFPMTQHVECLATLVPRAGGPHAVPSPA